MITPQIAVILLIGCMSFGLLAILVSIASGYKMTPVWEGKDAIRTEQQLQQLRDEVEKSESEYDQGVEEIPLQRLKLSHITFEDPVSL